MHDKISRIAWAILEEDVERAVIILRQWMEGVLSFYGRGKLKFERPIGSMLDISVEQKGRTYIIKGRMECEGDGRTIDHISRLILNGLIETSERLFGYGIPSPMSFNASINPLFGKNATGKISFVIQISPPRKTK